MGNKKEKREETWQTLKEAYYAVSQMSCKPEHRKVRNGEVLDEEKSVRWNREEVERLRAEYDAEVVRLNKAKSTAFNEVQERAVRLVAKETGLSNEKAKFLWLYCWEHFHANLEGLCLSSDELCLMVYQLMH